MTDRSNSSKPPTLPDRLVEQFSELDTQQLRETIEFAQERLTRSLEVDPETLEANDEDIVRVEEQPAYTTVVRREPQGEVMYHVTKVPELDGGERLQWRYLGPVADE